MSQTNFTQTANINLVAGHSPNADWDGLKRQADLIQSELNELYENIEKRNVEALRDDVCDVLFTAYGFGYRANLPVDQDYAEVCRSNMTKFDVSVADAGLTADKYLKLGVQTYYVITHVGDDPMTRLTYYVTKSAVDQVGTDGKSYPHGKWLKSYRFEEPQFSARTDVLT